MAFVKEEFLAGLVRSGEDKVRELLATGAMADPKKVALANEWLRRKGQERSDFSNREQMRIARSAKNAAWAAAIAAIIAAICAIVALISNPPIWLASSFG